VQDRVPHGQAPHGAGIASSGIMVGQRRYGARGTGQPAGVVQEGERDRGGAHERPIAARSPGAGMVG
jgi:hypothetical protein